MSTSLVPHLRGYTIHENSHCKAVCIDLNIVAVGSDMESATRICRQLVQNYLDDVCSHSDGDINKYIPRSADPELLAEYETILRQAILDAHAAAKHGGKPSAHSIVEEIDMPRKKSKTPPCRLEGSLWLIPATFAA